MAMLWHKTLHIIGSEKKEKSHHHDIWVHGAATQIFKAPPSGDALNPAMSKPTPGSSGAEHAPGDGGKKLLHSPAWKDSCCIAPRALHSFATFLA